MDMYENPPCQPGVYENPLVQPDEYEPMTVPSKVSASLAAQRHVYLTLPTQQYEGCSSYLEPRNLQLEPNTPRISFYNSIENMHIYEEIPDNRASYLSLKNDVITETKTEPAGNPHSRKWKLAIVLAIIVTLILGIGVGTFLNIVPSMTIAVDQTSNTTSTQAAITPTEGLTSCAAIHMSNPSAPNGTYTIYPGGQGSGRRVWCDMTTDEGGWTVFQRRINGSLDFNQTWDMYERGFGLPESEMWLGNEDIHRLTAAQPSELRVDLFDWDGGHGYAKYSTFIVGNVSTNYTLHVGGYIGNTIGDTLAYHNSMQFTTMDRDNDRYGVNCATLYDGGGGGWWYRSCDLANLNGRYRHGGVEDESGLEWEDWPGHPAKYSYKATSMMVRPQN